MPLQTALEKKVLGKEEQKVIGKMEAAAVLRLIRAVAITENGTFPQPVSRQR